MHGAKQRAALRIGAHVGNMAIAAIHQTIGQQEATAVSQKSVSFHLAESDTAMAFSALDGLHCHRVYRACGSHLALITHHVAQPLVVDYSHIDISVHDRSRYPRIQRLAAVVRVSLCCQLFPEVVHYCEGFG